MGMKSGDIAGGNYSEIESDGTIIEKGDATTWDDLRVSPNSLPEIGAQSPNHVVVLNNGEGGTSGDSIGFNGENQYATLGDYADLDAIGDATFSFWIKPYSDYGTVFFRQDYVQVRKSYDSLVISFDGSWEIWVNNALTNNANHHVAIVFDAIGFSTKVIVYVNNVEVYNSNVWGYQLAAQSTDLVIGYDTDSDYINADIDEFHFYNTALSSSQVSELYNGGDGTTSVPTGITEATDLIFRFHFDSPNETDNDSTLGAGEDLVFTNSPTNEDPLITTTGTAGSFGVVVLEFPPDVTTQVFFTAQIPHTYVEGTDIYPHVHWQYKEPTSGYVVWGLEYVWTNVNGTIASGTTIAENAIACSGTGAGIHHANNITTISGTGMKISSMLTCRLYRNGESSEDTYSYPVYLGEFDFHFQTSTLGSREVWSK